MNLPAFALSTLTRHWRLIGIALIVAALGVQTMRLKSERAASALFRAQVEAKMSDALAKALIANHEKEARHVRDAEQSELAHIGQLDDARAAADRFIAANRMRACGGSPASIATAPAKNRDPAVPASPAALPVMVSEADVQICSAVTAYALDAYGWALSFNED